MPNFRFSKYDSSPQSLAIDDPNKPYQDVLEGSTAVRVAAPALASQSREVAQAAANVAMAQGSALILGAGTWDFTSGGIVFDTGPVESGSNFYGARVYGEGIAATKILVGAGQRAFTFTANGRNSQNAGVFNLAILGPGIGSGAVGIQFGGISTGNSDLNTRTSVENVQIDNVTSCIIADDVSIFNISDLRLIRYKYGFEWGYNVDDVRIKDLYAGHEQTLLAGAACVITNGSNVITGLGAFVTAGLQVGYAISAPGRFPPGCYVGAITTTTVTVVNFNNVPVNATASGTQVWFPLGRLFNFGTRVAPTAGALYPSKGSPFVSPFWSTSFPAQAGRVNATNHEYQGLANDQELLIDMGGGSHALIRTKLYAERFARLAIYGDPLSDQQPLSQTFENCYFGQNQTVNGSPIVIEANAQEFQLTVKDCFSDSAPIAYPWVICTGFFGSGRLNWEENNLQASSPGQVQFGSADQNFASQPKISYGGAMYLGSSRKGDAIQTWINQTWMYYGQDVLEVPLVGGSRTIDFPVSYNILSTGKRLIVRIIAQGANTVTFGAGWFNAAGGAAGVVAAGTTGQVMHYEFLFTGSKFIAQNNPVWVTP